MEEFFCVYYAHGLRMGIFEKQNKNSYSLSRLILNIEFLKKTIIYI